MLADNKLIARWDERLNACQDARLNFERQWYENISFFFGRQWITIQRNPNGGFSLVEQPPRDRWRVRHTSNRILRIIRTELTKLTKEEPQFFCKIKSTDEGDRLAAMAGDAIAEFILDTRYFNKTRTLATFWMLMCGTAYIKNYFMPDVPDMDGNMGKTGFEAVAAPHLFVPNLQTTEMEEQPYVFHNKTVNPEDVFNTYGVEVEPTTSGSNILDSRFLSSLGIKQGKSEVTKQVYVKEVYIKKCKDFPNGAMFAYADNKLLFINEEAELAPVGEFENQQQLTLPAMQEKEDDKREEVEEDKDVEAKLDYKHEYPYEHGRFPFAKIDHIPTGMWYSESIIKTLISPQREYNRTRSVMLEHRNLAGKPQWWFHDGAFDTRKWDSTPGLLLPVRMGFDPPQMLEQPPLSPSVSSELDIIITDMDDISSQFEVSKGRVPPGVEAASAISYLTEENDSILHHSIASIEAAVQETGVQVLSNVYVYWSEDRIVRNIGRNQFANVREFKKDDLNPITDFRVVAGSMAPRSIAAKQAFITELMKMGAIEPEKALRYLQMSETDQLYNELMLDVRHAQRENIYMADGMKLTKPDPNPQQLPVGQNGDVPGLLGQIQQPQVKMDVTLDPMTGRPRTGSDGQPIMHEVTINPFDNHEIHIEEHQNFQKTQEYEMLSPEIQYLIQEHVDEHKLEMLKERNAIQADKAYKGEDEETIPPRELENAGPSRSY